MTFTSLTFVLFATLVIVGYWTLASKASQNRLLLAASYVFYGWWDWRFCFLILGSSLFDYVVSMGMDRTDDDRRRKCLMAASVAANLGLLALFKYFNFFVDSFQTAAAAAGWSVQPMTLRIILPVGISFYTFQTLGYTIDVYRRQVKPCRNLIDYLTFISFFPQLVAGPIERASAMLPQFAVRRKFDADDAREGLRLILWGTVKKLIIANRLAIIVDGIYSSADSHSGPTLMLATVCFAFQIYCDFSAYSDIATGVARLLGIRLMRNFAYPYFSQSVGEFWRRWHISLSTWFRDYVYIPMGGSQVSLARRRFNLLVTFLVSGLWHGAAWRFVAWGGINGAAVALPGGGSNLRGQTPGGETLIASPKTMLRIWSTFAVICAAWIFFRAESFTGALEIHRTILTDLFSPSAYAACFAIVDGDKFFRSTLILLAVFALWEWCNRRRECPLTLTNFPRPMRWSIYTTLIWMTLYWMPQAGNQEFIYFDF